MIMRRNEIGRFIRLNKDGQYSSNHGSFHNNHTFIPDLFSAHKLTTFAKGD